MRTLAGTIGSGTTPSVPGAYVTCTPSPARAVMPASGDTTGPPTTAGEPPSMVCVPGAGVVADHRDRADTSAPSGSRSPSFLRRTLPCARDLRGERAGAAGVRHDRVGVAVVRMIEQVRR